MNAVDTNVLVYAYDDSSPQKCDRARKLLSELTDCVLLWQVACEFLSASRKLLADGAPFEAVWERLDEIRAAFPLVLPGEANLSRARQIQSTTSVQFWDAMIYAGCLESGVTRLYSEDVPGQSIPGLDIINPF